MVQSVSVLFCVVLALLFANAQDLPETSTEIAEPRQLQGIVSVVQSITQTIQEIINGIRTFIGDLIGNLIGRIRDVITSIPGNVVGLTTRLASLVIRAGENGRHCIQTQKVLVTDLVLTVTNGSTNCVREAETKIRSLRNQLATLVGNVSFLQQDLTDKISNCIQNSLLNPLSFVLCLTEQIGSVRVQVLGVQTEVSNTLRIAKQTAFEATSGLATCVALVKVDKTRKEIEILGASKRCVAGLVGK